MSATIDEKLWSAIGEPTRRHIVDLLLSNGSGTATSLSTGLPVSRQAVAKHLTVLAQAGLVRSMISGREKAYVVDAAQMDRVVAQLTSVSRAWDRRLHRIKQVAEAVDYTNRTNHRRTKQAQTEQTL